MNIQLQVLGSALSAVAEEMGAVLVRAAFSPNIKERRDCSTAIFDERGRTVAQAEHIPVHLGALPDAVAAVAEHDPQPGEAWILNDPFAGGTHLPDVTLVSRTELGFAATRAHHADVGGMEPGSMPAGSTRLEDEGVVIPPTGSTRTRSRRWSRRCGIPTSAGAICARSSAHSGSASGGSPSSAHAVGASTSPPRWTSSAPTPSAASAPVSRDSPTGATRPRTCSRRLRVAAGPRRAHRGRRRGRARLRRHVAAASGQPQLPARGHALGMPLRRALLDGSGRARVRRRAGAGHHPCAARLARQRARPGGRRRRERRDLVPDRRRRLPRVCAGGPVPAQGQGTMNNVTLGNERFTYYETIGGGQGGCPDGDGPSAVHVSMSNTLNTPIEALELALPLRVERYALRPGSGGRGRHRGGDGVVRELRTLEPCRASVIAERRSVPPAGEAGGEAGAPGRTLLNGRELPAKVAVDLDAGDVLRVETPGGGAWGGL